MFKLRKTYESIHDFNAGYLFLRRSLTSAVTAPCSSGSHGDGRVPQMSLFYSKVPVCMALNNNGSLDIPVKGLFFFGGVSLQFNILQSSTLPRLCQPHCYSGNYARYPTRPLSSESFELPWQG
jgi:hypothetical protein